MTTNEIMIGQHSRFRERLPLATLLCIHVVTCCVSLVYVATVRIVTPAALHIFYDPSQLWSAIIAAAAFAVISVLFWLSNFSFGYFVGFYLYTMILGYLWQVSFTDLHYGHGLAKLSAIASAVTFLLPTLFIRSPIRQTFVLSAAAFEKILALIILLGVATVLIGATYDFHFVGIENIYQFREKLQTPTALRYLIGITSSALLPFAFACFVVRKAYFRATFVIVLLIFFYPITFSKLALFTPLWLVAMLLLSKLVEARIAVVLSLTIPIALGILLIVLFRADTRLYFSIVNVRMVAIPSVAMDVYNDFFSKHELTYFCQISFLKPIMQCPYQDPLSVVMEKAYKLGNFNASLFATEGIASVGVLLAPITALASGLLISFGNRSSSGLPPSFVLVSGAVIPQVILNVPLTTIMLTHGLAFLFLLWYVTPRTIFDPEDPVRQPVET